MQILIKLKGEYLYYNYEGESVNRTQMEVKQL
jgi:hypothetical protein